MFIEKLKSEAFVFFPFFSLPPNETGLSMILPSTSDLELKPSGTLDVKLVQAKDLTNKDIIGKSDPFAVLFVRPLPDKMKTSKTIVRYLPSSTYDLFFSRIDL